MKRFIFTLMAVMAASAPLLGQPIIMTQPTNEVVFGSNNVTFTVTASGSGPLTYQWQFNGTNLPNDTITTVAGNGFLAPNNGFYSGDGGPATNASLNFPLGLALDAQGNIFIADTGNDRVRKVDTNGIITTMAGNGTNGYTGDGGYATNASISNVSGLAFDGSGNLYLADTGNNSIREVATNGIITTVFTNLNGPASLAFDLSGNLFVADTGNGRIQKYDTQGNVLTVASGLNLPYGVAVDTNGNLYIADTYDDRVDKVDTNGDLTDVAGYGILEGFSGDGGPATNAQVVRPKGVALDPAQNIYIADTFNERIREINSNGIINTVVGNGAGYPNGAYGGDDGAATNASLYDPTAMAFSPSGNLYFVDSWNERIRTVDFGGLPALTLQNVSLTNNGDYTVVVTDSSGSVTSVVASLTVLVPAIIKVQPVGEAVPVGGNFTLTVGAHGSEPLFYQWFFDGTVLNDQTNSSLTVDNVSTNQSGSYDVVVTNLYGNVTSAVASVVAGYAPAITNLSPNQVVIIGGNVLLSAGVTGTGPFTYQWQLNGTNLPKDIITTIAGRSVQGYSGDNGLATNASLNLPAGVGVDGLGNVFIADTHDNRIRRVDGDGIITTVAGNGSTGYSGDGVVATNTAVYAPDGVVLNAQENLFIADTGNSRVRKVNVNDMITTVAGTNGVGYSGDGGLATSARLNQDSDVALDAAGNLYIADRDDSRIRKVGTNGIITTVAGTGLPNFSGDGGAATSAAVNNPYGVTVDAAGNLYIADTENNRVRMVNTNGIITTVAGKGSPYPFGAFSGDGGPATNAFLNGPRSVAIDPAGDLFIADAGNSRIREVNTAGIITTIAGDNSAGFSGDGGASTNASLADPQGVAFDDEGNLLIADTANNRVREVSLFAAYNSLSLRNLNGSEAGNYDLIVSSPFGSVTGSVVQVTLALPPIIPSFNAGNGTLNFTWAAVPNLVYQLQYTASLNPPAWQNLGSPIVATNGTVSVSDVPGTDAQKFYRVQLVP